ncbi:MAG: GNAT family N-acetyltransferase, partial [Saprospiraceae bacterium]|nr:GNAT family N-acetyltransferase [Saprospiraceae bacterium]
DDRLVGFILHGVDGAAACNVGTGVLPAYRGRRLVQEMYAFVMPLLRQKGVRHLGLEVITDNAAAIKAYERAGFVICRTLLCFAGEVVDQPERALTIRSRPVTSEQLGKASGHGSYAWDHIDAGILALADAYQLYEVCKDDTFIGQIVLHPDTGILARCDLAGPETLEGYRCLLEAAGRVQRKIRIVNVDERLRTRISAIGESGLLLTLKQYEMERAL